MATKYLQTVRPHIHEMYLHSMFVNESRAGSLASLAFPLNPWNSTLSTVF